MKKAISIFLFICITLSVFAQGFVVLHYYANKAYIVKNLCENRSRPILNCNGKCVLAKKLAAQEKDQKDKGIFFTEKFEVLASTEGFITVPPPISKQLSDTHFKYIAQPLSKGFTTIFQPPDCA